MPWVAEASLRRTTMPRTCAREMITLASRCQGNCRHQLSQCSGKRRVNQITPGTIASHVIPLDNSQTAGSHAARSEEHTSELQSLMRISYAVFCLKKKTKHTTTESTPKETNKD